MELKKQHCAAEKERIRADGESKLKQRENELLSEISLLKSQHEETAIEVEKKHLEEIQ